MTLELSVRRFSCPLSRPLETAGGTIESRDGFLIRISDGEQWGLGEASPLPGFTESVATCEAALEAAAEAIDRESTGSGSTSASGSGPTDGSTTADDARDANGSGSATGDGDDGRSGSAIGGPFPNAGSAADASTHEGGDGVGDENGGCIPAALAAVEHTSAARHGLTLALADLAAVRESIPLYQQLGTPDRVARVPVNATIGDGTPEETADEAESAVDAGFSCCKVKAGVRPIEEDLQRIRRVRETVGTDTELRVDANGAWSIDEARHALEAFADLDVAILEQPLPAGALEGHAELRGNGVEIVLDEGLLEHGVDAIVSASAADGLVCKPMALGGVDVARQVAAWAAESELTTIVTTTIDAVVGRTGAVHLAASIPDVPACGLATGSLLATDLGRDPVFVERGAAVVPQGKGLGVSEVWDA